MNDKEFGSLEVLKFKYRREDQIIHTFRRVSFPKKLIRNSLIGRNSRNSRKLSLIQAERIVI